MITRTTPYPSFMKGGDYEMENSSRSSLNAQLCTIHYSLFTIHSENLHSKHSTLNSTL